MLKREISQKIKEFLEGNKKKALLIDGARQVGKTYIIRSTLNEMGINYIEINFIENKAAKDLFSNFNDSIDIINRISILTNKELKKGKTVIFFDEVQEVKEIVTAIKFLVDEGSYKYVLSGSMLGVELQDIKSQPVGYLDEIKMYPMDFSEFITAVGIKIDTIEIIKECFNNNNEVDELINNKMLELFRLYCIVGGMPAVVSRYIETNDLNEVLNEQRNIMLRYREDIVKYVDKDKIYIKTIFDNIPSELNKTNKRFIYSNMGKGFRFDREQNSFVWLTNAGVANACFVVDELKIPLKISKATNLFKLYQSDVGLLVSTYNKELQKSIISNEADINFGAIYENAVSQLLNAHGFSLYYYNNKKRGEIDFVIEHNNGIYIMEIKSGKTYNRHRALNNVVSDKLYGINTGYVFGNCNVYKTDNIQYYPIYMVDLLRYENNNEKLIYKIDL